MLWVFNTKHLLFYLTSVDEQLANAREIYEREYKKEQGDKPAKKVHCSL